MDNLELVTKVLLELKISAKKITSEKRVSEKILRQTISKYGLLFFGDQANNIHARQLQSSLENIFNIQISISDLLVIIPKVCDQLGMKIDAETFVNDPERKISDYRITLF